MWQVDRFRDGTADKRLCGTHHADMTVCMDIAHTFLSTFVGTVKNGQVLFFQEGRPFKHHGTAYVIVSGLNLLIGKSKCFQQTPFKVVILLRDKAETLK